MLSRYRSGLFYRAVLMLTIFNSALQPLFGGVVQVATYTSGASGVWDDATRWDLNVIPDNVGTTTNYKAVIGSPASTVNLALGTTRTVDGLDLGGTLNVAGTLNVSGLNAGDNPNAGILTNTSALNISSGGKLVMQSGNTSISDGLGAVIAIANGGELRLDSTSLGLAGNGTLTMTGTAALRGVSGTESLFNSSAISGAGSIHSIGYVQNDGAIAASGGTLTIQPGASGFYNNGTLSAASGATLTIANTGTWSNLSGSTLTGGIYDVTGTMNYTGAQLEMLSGASVILHGTGKLQATGGVNALAPLHTLQDASLTLDNATRSTAGSLTVSNTGSLNLTNTGKLTVNGNLAFNPGSDLLNQTVLDLDNADVTVTGSFKAGTVLMSGLSKVTAASLQNVSLIGGQQTLAYGNISLSGGSDLTIAGGSGIQRIYYGAAVSMADGGTTFTINGTHALAGLVRNDGVLSLADASQSLGLGAFDNNITGELYLSNNAGLTFSGSLSNAGTFSHSGGNVTSAGLTNTGTIVVSAGSTFNASTGAFTSYDAGTKTLTEGTYDLDGTFIVNSADIVRNNASVSLGSGSTAFVDNSSGLFALRNLAVNNGTLETTGRTMNLTNLLQGETGSGFETPVLRLNSASTMDLSGNLTNQAGAKVYVNSGSTLNVAGNMTGSAFTELYVNSGTVNAGTFSNPGRLEMSNGVFNVTGVNGFASVNSAGKLFEGSYELLHGSTFNYNGAAIQTIGSGVSLSLTNSTISHCPTCGPLGGPGNAIAGLSTIEAGGTLLVGSGAPVSFTAGTLTNNGSLYLGTQTADFAGTVVNNGTLNATGASVVTAAALQNAGSLLVSSGSTMTVGALSNISGGILSGGILSGGTYRLENGILRANNTTGITGIAAGTTVRLDGTGAFQNNVGANALSQLASNAGSLTLDEGHALTTSAAFANSNILMLQGGSSLTANGFSSTGSVHVAGGTIQINGTFGNISGDTLQGGSWTLDSSGVGTSSYIRSTTGQINAIASNATVAMYGADSGFFDGGGSNDLMSMLGSNAGTLGFYGRSLTTGAALFLNSGDLTISDATFTVAGMTNTGQATIGAGGIVQTTNGYTQAAGTTTNNGEIVGDVTLSGGTLKGTGTTTGNLTVGSGGTFSPGNSPGTYTVNGDFTALGTLSMEIGGLWQGLSYDWLDVLGTANLGGTLKISLVDGFTSDSLAVGDVFTLITWLDRTGEFTGFNFPTLGPGKYFEWFYNESNFEVRITDVNPVPEPGTMLLFGSALVGLGIVVRRRVR